MGPDSKFCLNCGIDKGLEDSEARVQDDPVQDPDETVDEVEEQEVEIEDKILHDDRSVDELDSKVKENMLDLKKSLGLIIWLVDLYLKGNVEKEHFNQYLNAYEYRLDQCLKHRSLMLEISKDQKQIETALNWAKLNLIEYKRKMKIGDISDEEYNLKVPVYEWDIRKYEAEIAKRNLEIQFLEEITHVMPEEEVVELKKIAINSQKTIQEQKVSNNYIHFFVLLKR